MKKKKTNFPNWIWNGKYNKWDYINEYGKIVGDAPLGVKSPSDELDDILNGLVM